MVAGISPPANRTHGQDGAQASYVPPWGQRAAREVPLLVGVHVHDHPKGGNAVHDLRLTDLHCLERRPLQKLP